MAVLGAEIARDALGYVQALGDRAQVGEVVQADVPHEAALRVGVGVGVGVGHPMARTRFDSSIFA